MSNNLERMQFDDIRDYILYRTTCRCIGHSLDLSIEYDRDIDSYMLCIGTEAYLLDYPHDSFFKRIWRRIKIATEYLFTGYVEFQTEFFFRNENHIREFLTELQKGLDELKEINKEK